MSKTARALLGIGLIAVLFFIVLAFWTQYQTANRAALDSKEATVTPSQIQKEGENGDSKAKAVSKKNTAEPKKGEKVVRVLIQGLNFRESPAPDANPIRGLDDGDTLILVSKEGNWYRVKDSQGTEGWVSANDQYTKVETAK